LWRAVVFFFFATVFRRAGLLTASVAALLTACFIAGVDRLIPARPTSSALAVDSSTTCVAAFAAAPRASPATDLTPFALRCAASAIASFAFAVIVLTIVHHLPGIAFDNAKSAATVPGKWSELLDIKPLVSDVIRQQKRLAAFPRTEPGESR
jgi:hypothetical protein